MIPDPVEASVEDLDSLFPNFEPVDEEPVQLHVSSVGIFEPFEHVAVTESDMHRPDSKHTKTKRKLLKSLETEARAMNKAGMGIAEGKFPGPDDLVVSR